MLHLGSLEALNGIYCGKTHSKGFIQIAEPPTQNVDERPAQGFNASLTTDLNASLNTKPAISRILARSSLSVTMSRRHSAFTFGRSRSASVLSRK